MVNIAKHPTDGNCITIQKNASEQIRLALREYEGRAFVDLRLFFRTDADEWQPTKKGLTLSPLKWPAFRQAIDQLDEEMRERGLLLPAEEGT